MDETFYEPGTIPPWNRETPEEPPPGYGLHPVIRHKRIIEAAAELGRIASDEGRPCVPAQDPAMMELLKDNHGERFGEGIEPLKAWTRAFIQANLDRPLPNDEEETDYDGPRCPHGLDPYECTPCSAASYAGSTFRACRHGYPPSECPTCNGEEE